jgi:hypothetical protein
MPVAEMKRIGRYDASSRASRKFLVFFQNVYCERPIVRFCRTYGIRLVG